MVNALYLRNVHAVDLSAVLLIATVEEVYVLLIVVPMSWVCRQGLVPVGPQRAAHCVPDVPVQDRELHEAHAGDNGDSL